ncbi:hypothetical protein Tco_0835740 [Tanacetum coccineum]
MSEEDQTVEVAPSVKSDMHSYSSTMTAKDVKALALKHNIPLDLHPVALTAEWTMDGLTDDCIGLYEKYFKFSEVRVPFSTFLLAVIDHFRVHISQLISKQGVGPGSGGKILNETFSGLKGWKKRFFFLDRRAIPQAMAWRHHDSDIHDPPPTDGFNALDVVALTRQCIDIRPVPSGLLFYAGLATTWEFPGFPLVFKDTEGNAVTMLEYLQFPFLDGATIGREVSDPRIVAIRERKARAAAKKRAEKKRATDGEGGSKGKAKRRKVSAVRVDEEDSTKAASSASPLQAVRPNPTVSREDVDATKTAESRENEHVSIPRHDSANTSIHNYAEDHDENFESEGHGLAMTEVVENRHADETELTGTPTPFPNPEKAVVQDLVPLTILRRSRVDTPEECRELLMHLAPPAIREEMNAYHNNTAMDRAWFSIARGAIAQADAILRFEALYDAYLAVKEKCEDATKYLVSIQTNFTHLSNLYNNLSSRHQQLWEEHSGCAGKLADVEKERDELRAVNADQASRIKELEAELVKKDSALVFSDRISNEKAIENEKLVSQIGFLEKKKIDSIGKLLPTVVRRLFESHEYKESLSVPFNLAIQAGWAKGLALKRSEEDLMKVLNEVRDKISGLPRPPVQELLKMYPAPPPRAAPTRANPSSEVVSASKAAPSQTVPTATTTLKVVLTVARSNKDLFTLPGGSKSVPKRG